MLNRKLFVFLSCLISVQCVITVPADESKKMSEETFKILVTHSEVPKEALALLSRACEVTIIKSLPPSRAEILEKIKGVHGLYWVTHDKLDAEILDAAGPQLKSVSTMSAGLDNVDIAELKKRNIPLGHTPTVLNEAVADLAMGLMLAAGRRFTEARQKIEDSQWENYHVEWMWGQETRDTTVGFYGFGGIGQTIAKRLSGFDVKQILYTTRHQVDADIEKKFNAKKASFDDMLAQSDYVFIAAPLTNETAGVFNASAFGKMKKTAVLINIARGGIVNQNDLYDALKTNEIFAAGLDVMTPEPLPSTDPLVSLPNCVLITHLGSATKRTRTDMSIIAAHNVLRGLAGEPMFAPAY